ncbi:type I secretion system permease/ATPase [Vineibacter terrae]|uniref:Type I secretion system permease/ATPase n=1 Tax=Vineibacter terrae TaxID=2586908 RepID=A0A5C8PJH0_9HYPH|nr:type I secretion system permease/ATPase [Vineibacter terrae]TXL73966.1 type I secretion system permease/ATPase [Vineibacter terrae]
MKTEIARLVRSSSGPYLGTAAAFSLAINLLYLAGPLYMLQLYDRVVPSSSEITLLMLTLVLLLAYLALAGLDAVRARVLTRVSVRLDRQIAPKVMTAIIDGRAGAGGARSELLRDFDSVRQFLGGAGIHAIFDLPWAPLYIVVIFMLHWALGAFALGCALLLILLALVNEWLIRAPLADANIAAARNYSFTEMSLRNRDAIRAMDMTEGLLRRWGQDRDRTLERQVVASDRAAAMQSGVKFLRLSMQSVILGLGAWLVIERNVTGGAMFAASLLLGRALQPVEQIVGTWRTLVSVRSAWRRLSDLFAARAVSAPTVSLPRPSGHLAVEELSFAVAGTPKPLLRGISFALQPGEVLGVIGPSGAGKSTLARHLVGVLAPSAGAVRLDGADVSAWARGTLGQHVGYLPQDIELFADTVAANINRFKPGDDDAIVRAARMAGVHELVLRLRQGYDTQVGEGGAVLSGGYRQRLALARAVYGDPSLVVLDEPSSNLDAEGDAALSQCIRELRQQGTTVVLVSHRLSTVGLADKLLVLKDGKVELFGPGAEILARLARGPQLQAVRSA